jgi:hypothetical protein
MKSKTQLIALILLSFILSCDSNSLINLEKKVILLNSDSSQLPYYQNFDTLSYLKKLNIKEEVNLIRLAQNSILDTFELILVPSMIPYAHWQNKKARVDSTLASCIFPTPSSKNLVLPKKLASYSSVIFIGKISPNSNKPVPELIYFYYKIKKPYFLFENKLQGFKVNKSQNGIDSIFGFSLISVR